MVDMDRGAIYQYFLTDIVVSDTKFITLIMVDYFHVIIVYYGNSQTSDTFDLFFFFG